MEDAQNNERRSGSRQFHRKSRNSCVPCRRRRVRCNLQPPICANCHRRNESCSYTSPNAYELAPIPFSKAQAKASAWKSNVGNNSKDFTGFGSTEFDLNSQALYDNMSLYRTWQQILDPCATSSMIQVMEETYLLSLLPNIKGGLFGYEFDRLASTFEYVHRTFTALYELHQWSQNTSRSNLYTFAYQHHIEASVLFRHSQPEVNGTNWMAVLIFGIGVIVFQFAAFLKTPDTIDNYLELLHILRGSFQLAIELAPFLRMSSLMLLTQPRLHSPKLHLDELVLNILACLDSLGYPEDTTGEMKRACLQSIISLKEWIIEVNGYPGNWRQYMDWPAAVPEEYLSAISQRHPTSLVIFIYWCSIMHRCPKRWYAGWASRAASVAMRHLGGEWNHVLEAPRKLLAFEPGDSNPYTRP
ncbi:hypothetical protein F4813DRAFT_375261 [Daldinia decipiens]|uniref:uncharacterized protein n=1 Tax=Daldinia decipiens TaxID=326647 RepID=UPI0020C46650|nr:uncharacterized protein F4813DRAFT_375261 [Daldinia decipiens]KAI1653268.1 hypothetical protein F4813DRAFT_375261 [Daldinia decipiens]